uniref:Pyroglutamylated RFamide peptide 2 n=1 Tax=Sphaeramia orbicularis TaxID=375764 RepID=A0A672YSR0_9TELE
MRLCFCPGSSRLAVLALILLCPIPWTVSSYPHPRPPAAAPLPTGDEPDLESALLRFRDAADEPWSTASESEEVLLRSERGDLVGRPLSPFPGGLSVDGLHYPVGETDDGGRRNDALNSIAGGLQAVSREKGGFGFRFGRKRWTERGQKRNLDQDLDRGQ